VCVRVAMTAPTLRPNWNRNWPVSPQPVSISVSLSLSFSLGRLVPKWARCQANEKLAKNGALMLFYGFIMSLRFSVCGAQFPVALSNSNSRSNSHSLRVNRQSDRQKINKQPPLDASGFIWPPVWLLCLLCSPKIGPFPPV